MSDPFDLDHYLALPRLSDLRLSPDGRRLVVAVGTVAPDGTRLRTALWSVDPDGARAPRQLTRSAKGEGAPAFLPDGSLLFVSERSDPDRKPSDDGKDEIPTGLWLLPADGGEARLLASPDAGIGAVRAARDRAVAVFSAAVHPEADSLERDAEIEKSRRDAGVSALLFERYPIQFWDHYLGPRQFRLFAIDVDTEAASGGRPDDLTGASSESFVDPRFDVAPDGSWVATGWRRWQPGAVGDDLVRLDRGGERRTLAGGPGNWHDPAISPDGRTIAVVFATPGAKDEASTESLRLVDAQTGEVREAAGSLDRWPLTPVWAADGETIYFTADDLGGVSVYRLDVAEDRVTRLAGGAAFSDLCESPDGSALFALRAHIDRPPHVVRLDPRAADQEPVELASPATSESDLPRRGVVERLTAKADDGTEIGSWLLRPTGASPGGPAPLVVFVHGGPLGTWAGWSWRWNANLLVERGYAVLMPDPAISLGYGQALVDRGWSRWGERPFTDIIAAVDGALEREDLDSGRTALMGGSFGGYMANWIAGHTDRFRAIVTHASLWELRGFHGTTDDGLWWEQEMGDPYEDASRYREHSPSNHLAAIRTPILVIHGEKDARVPISEALRLWTDLQRNGVPARFLYFPDEGHWVLKPQNTRLWYETVLAFLDEHVLGRAWARPALL